MTAYEELLEFGGERIFDFLKNARLHESQFKYITSIFSPEDIYAGVVSRENQGKDTIKQLLRRITKYVYHYKVGDEYKAYELAGDQYIDFDDLKRRATGTEFMQIDDEDIPFD